MKRVLIVDDEAFLLQWLSGALESPATYVMMVETGAAAIAEITSSPYQLCFLNFFLPDLDGANVLTKIHELSPETKVVVMTAEAVSREARDLIENNAYMFITKPCELLQVKLIAKRALEEPNLPRG